MAEHFHSDHPDPDTYLERDPRALLPRYDELQDRAVEAIEGTPKRVLELGIGTGETTRRLLERFPDAEVTGLDASPEMVFRAREMGIEVRLARMEDPLPDGPWDLVIAVLAVHHLDVRPEAGPLPARSRAVAARSCSATSGRRRVQVARARARARLPRAPPERLAEWCGGEVVWQDDDLAVIRATYD